MATNGDTQATVAPVLAALATLQANVEQAQKNEAHEYLQQFQKSVRIPSPALAAAIRHFTQANPP